ncbi:MAG: hypothetical protein RR048_02215 [Oscillospiraceae bacterium]
MEISLQGYNNKYVTMKIKTGAEVGNAMDITENNTASKAADGKAPIGKLVSQNGEYGLIQTSGAIEFPFSGTSPSFGYTTIACDGLGGIKASATGRPVIVSEVNETAKTAIVIL